MLFLFQQDLAFLSFTDSRKESVIRRVFWTCICTADPEVSDKGEQERLTTQLKA